jgi:hypothetical protein
MVDVTQLTRIEEALRACDEQLRSAPPSPAVRELRVRQGALARVVRGWAHVPPHDAQVAAMLECALELRALVGRMAARRSTRPPGRGQHARPLHARTTRPPPRREAAVRTTRPPPPASRSDAPPSSGGARD